MRVSSFRSYIIQSIKSNAPLHKGSWASQRIHAHIRLQLVVIGIQLSIVNCIWSGASLEFRTPLELPLGRDILHSIIIKIPPKSAVSSYLLSDTVLNSTTRMNRPSICEDVGYGRLALAAKSTKGSQCKCHIVTRLTFRLCTRSNCGPFS